MARLLATMLLLHSLPFASAGGSGALAVVGIVGATLLFVQPLVRGKLVPSLRPGLAMALLFACLILAAALVLRFHRDWNLGFVVGDVLLFTFSAQFIQTPEEASHTLVQSLWRAVRLALPVAIVILTIFELFPSVMPRFAPRGRMAESGFGTGGDLNPGDASRLALSERVAFVARLAERRTMAGELYWRGQILTRNEGLRWGQGALAWRREEVPPLMAGEGLRQEIRLAPRFGGFAFALDYPVRVSERGAELRSLWGGVFVSAQVRNATRTLEALSRPANGGRSPSSAERMVLSDVPERGALEPLVRRIFPAGASGAQAAALLSGFFADEGFEYTLSPGAMPGVGAASFLQIHKRGFCEHYAAASANLLRAAGFPARVVTGFFGGEWNPVDGSFVVRDRDAHAWVEFWDEGEKRWLRFDATQVLSPERFQRVARDLTPSAWSYVTGVPAALVTALGDLAEVWEKALDELEARLPDWEPRTILGMLMALALGTFGVPWVAARALWRGGEQEVPRLRADFLRMARRHRVSIGHSDTVAAVARALARRTTMGELPLRFAETFDRIAYGSGESRREGIASLKALLRAMKKVHSRESR